MPTLLGCRHAHSLMPVAPPAPTAGPRWPSDVGLALLVAAQEQPRREGYDRRQEQRGDSAWPGEIGADRIEVPTLSSAGARNEPPDVHLHAKVQDGRYEERPRRGNGDHA